MRMSHVAGPSRPFARTAGLLHHRDVVVSHTRGGGVVGRSVLRKGWPDLRVEEKACDRLGRLFL